MALLCHSLCSSPVRYVRSAPVRVMTAFSSVAHVMTGTEHSLKPDFHLTTEEPARYVLDCEHSECQGNPPPVRFLRQALTLLNCQHFFLKRLFHIYEVHAVSCQIGNGGCFPVGKEARNVKLSSHLQLVPKSRYRGSVPPPPHTQLPFTSVGQ
jgi:hypothetical protein